MTVIEQAMILEKRAERERILYSFAKTLVSSQKDLPTEYSQVVNDNFWELID